MQCDEMSEAYAGLEFSFVLFSCMINLTGFERVITMKTEIFGTLGPACQDEEILVRMFEAGMTGMRLNMSHASLYESRKMIEAYQNAARKAGCKAELLIDMQGPEIRVGTLNRPLMLNNDGLIELRRKDQHHASSSVIPTPPAVMEALAIDDEILLDDGKIALQVVAITAKGVRARVIRGGTLLSSKSIKIVGKDVTGPALTSQDRENIRQIRNYQVTSLMQPFVRSGRELMDVKAELRKNHCEDIRLFAKIENMQGIAHLDEIMKEADMLVIARGDLGNDMPLYELPRRQKEIEAACLKVNQPFLVVTQMLQSMIHAPIPTRAEVSDIFNAVVDGAAAVMVTNETAVGEYPVEVIHYLTETVRQAEAYLKTLP